MSKIIFTKNSIKVLQMLYVLVTWFFDSRSNPETTSMSTVPNTTFSPWRKITTISDGEVDDDDNDETDDDDDDDDNNDDGDDE